MCSANRIPLGLTISATLTALAVSVSAVTTTSFAHASEHTFSSVTEVQEFQEDSDQYKFCLFPSEDGDIEIRIETHKGSDLTLNKNGTLTITGPSGDSGIEIPSMTEVTGRYPALRN